MKIDRRIIGPEDATELLSKNNHNRLISHKLADRFADDMAHGRWLFLGDPIRLAEDGTLLDGQHRLLAIIKSGTKQEFVVITGLSTASQAVMDTGRSRRLHDVLKINGEKNHNILAAALVLVWGLDNGVDFAISTSNWRPSNAQALATLERHPGLRDSCNPGNQLSNHMRMPGSIAVFRHYQFGLIDPDDRDDFFDRLIRKDWSGPTDPLGQLYFVVMADAASHQRKRPIANLHALFVKAWNHYRQGTEVKQLKWARGGRAREQFPEAI